MGHVHPCEAKLVSGGAAPHPVSEPQVWDREGHGDSGSQGMGEGTVVWTPAPS